MRFRGGTDTRPPTISGDRHGWTGVRTGREEGLAASPAAKLGATQGRGAGCGRGRSDRVRASGVWSGSVSGWRA